MVVYLLEEGVRLVYLADSDSVSMYIYYMGEVMFLITLRQNRPPKKSRVRFLNNLKDFLQNSH